MLVSDAVRRGSSPLMRGKHVRSDVDVVAAGLIPAHAGKTEQAVPASRGRLIPAHAGKRGNPAAAGLDNRLIPAHAGKTRGRAHRPWPRSAHPRSHGENCAWLPMRLTIVGSSPLTRGKRARPDARAWDPRLIPAHAGKTRSQSLLAVGRSAHPRSRGENIRESKGRSIIAGSSPLTRGKRLVENRPGQFGRLIPAHAGKTQVDNLPCP